MEDEAWRCIILALSANALASLTGSPSNYVDSHSLLDEALRQLKSRVASGSLPTDQTLGAISCLAMWSVSHWVASFYLCSLCFTSTILYYLRWFRLTWWRMTKAIMIKLGFMPKALQNSSKCEVDLPKSIVEWDPKYIGKGSTSSIDIHGCNSYYLFSGVFDIAVDVDQPPLLDEGLRDSPSREIISEDSLDSESELASTECRVPPRLSSIFHDITQLNAVVDDAMTRNIKLDTDNLYESVFGIYNRLLSCQPGNMSDCDNSLRISLILYIKSLTSGGRFNATSMNLVRKLQASIQGCLHSPSPLTRWKLFIGSLAASDGTTEQQWFLQHSATAMAESDMTSADGWMAFQEELSSILWVKPVLEAAGYNLWLQIMGANSTWWWAKSN